MDLFCINRVVESLQTAILFNKNKFVVPCCDVRCNFHVTTMFISSYLPFVSWGGGPNVWYNDIHRDFHIRCYSCRLRVPQRVPLVEQ